MEPPNGTDLWTTGRMTMKRSTLTAQWRAAELARLKQKFQVYLSDYASKHDAANAERIARAFVADHPELLAEFVELFISDIFRQRQLWSEELIDF
jgi:hypothetical protein